MPEAGSVSNLISPPVALTFHYPNHHQVPPFSPYFKSTELISTMLDMSILLLLRLDICIGLGCGCACGRPYAIHFDMLCIHTQVDLCEKSCSNHTDLVNDEPSPLQDPESDIRLTL